MKIPKKIIVNYSERANLFSHYISDVSFLKKNGDISNNNFNEDLKNQIFENVPRTGFYLNRDINEEASLVNKYPKAIIFDPLGFEFEIPFSNLLEILKTNNFSNNQLEGEYIISFKGNTPLLLSTKSTLYKDLVNNTNSFPEKLVVGKTYVFKGCNDHYIYLGKLNIKEMFHEEDEDKTRYKEQTVSRYYYVQKNTKTKHLFFNKSNNIIQELNPLKAEIVSNHIHDVSSIIKVINDMNDFEYKIAFNNINFEDLIDNALKEYPYISMNEVLSNISQNLMIKDKDNQFYRLNLSMHNETMINYSFRGTYDFYDNCFYHSQENWTPKRFFLTEDSKEIQMQNTIGNVSSNNIKDILLEYFKNNGMDKHFYQITYFFNPNTQETIYFPTITDEYLHSKLKEFKGLFN